MALLALHPGVGAAFRDALFGLASIRFDPSRSELQLSRRRLEICCRDAAGENLGILSMYLEYDCSISSAGGIFPWAEDRAVVVSPLNLLSHLRISMLDLPANHTLIVSLRFNENDDQESLVSLGAGEHVSIFRFFFPISREIAANEAFIDFDCPSPSVYIPAKYCVEAAIRLGGLGTYDMVISRNARECTFFKQGQDPRQFTLTKAAHGIGHNGRRGLQIEETERSVTLSKLYPLLFGCRYPNHLLSTVYIPLNPATSTCICYDISELIVLPN